MNSLALFVEEDEQAENKRYRNMCDKVVDAFVELPGLEVRTVHDEYDFLIPMALLTFTRDWKGPSREEVWNYLANGMPAIYTGNIGSPDDLAVDPFNLTDTELETVIGRLHEILVG